MVCLDCDYALDGLRSRECPECGREFDPQDSSTFQRVLHDGVRLARLPLTEAQAACMYLEDHGVPAAVHREAGGIIAETETAQGLLWVDHDDLERARALLDEMSEPTEQAEDWPCPGCGEAIEGQFAMCWNCSAERPVE